MLTRESVPRQLALIYVVIGGFLVLSQYTLNDEGLLTHYWARWAWDDFLAVFFFQKLKPILTTIYALPSAAGTRGTLLAHVVVAAAAIPMIAAVARALGHRLPNLPALILACSPLYFYGGSAGFSNNDGIVGVLLVLYLWCARDRPFAAGVVAGLLPWVRAELATFCLLLAAFALVDRRQRLLIAGMLTFPLTYWLAGSLYHQDVLWMVHYPPSAPSDLGNPIWSGQLIGFRYLLEPAMAVTPLAALVVAIRWHSLHRIERMLLLYALLTVLTIHVLPMFRIGNFGSAPRYLLHLLPPLALLVSRAIEPWWEERPRLGAAAVLALAAVWMVTRQQDARAVVVLLLLYAALPAAVWLKPGKLGVAVAALMAVAGPLLPLRTDAIRPPYLESMLAWLQARSDVDHRRIYTNTHLLAPYLERRLLGVEVFDLATPEMTREMMVLTNPHNGQRDAIRERLAADLYGRAIVAPIGPDDLPAGAVLALREDPRLPLLLPTAAWSSRLELLVQTPEYRIARVVAQGAIPRGP